MPCIRSQYGYGSDQIYSGGAASFPGAPSLTDSAGFLLQDLDLPDAGPTFDSFSELSESHLFQSHEQISPSPQSSTSPSQGSDSRPRGEGGETTPPATISDAIPSVESLELVPDAFSFYIGPTGAADVHLLKREDFDTRNITRPRIQGLRHRRLDKEARRKDGDQDVTIFGITDEVLLRKAEPRADEEAIEGAWSELWNTITPDTAWRLIKLYARFIDPYFPILASQQLPSSSGELSNVPLALLAAMCASALPFVVHDEGLYGLLLHPPSTSRLYRICWLDIRQRLHAPTLATLQACLLLQQRLPTNAYLSDTAFAWSLMSTAVAVAQTIGLHRDPTGWSSVPRWERKLRSRLWWAVWTMERWVSLVRGMPSHINDDDFDVSDLTPEAVTDTLSSSLHTTTHLQHLVKLTRILADIQKTYYTVRTMNRTSRDLNLSLNLARIPRAQLKSWLDSLGLGLLQSGEEASAHHDLDGSASLQLSYIVTHITLFRALLRPLENWEDKAETYPARVEAAYGAAKAVIKGSLVCVTDFVTFLEGLRDAQWNAFWHSWSRPNFAIAGSFMVHVLHLTSTSSGRRDFGFQEEDGELRALVKRWRVAIRVSANGAAGARGLANLGLLRVETMLGRLVASDDT